MKKIILVLSFVLLVIATAGCSKEQMFSRWIEGSWCLTEQNEIYWYWELNSDGTFVYYDLNGTWLHSPDKGYATFENGTLFTPSECTWEESLKGQYHIEGYDIYVNDIVIASVEKINENKAMMKSTVLKGGIVERIRKIESR